jgi:3-oxoacyl-[acyl-carrier protein] reductase
MQLLLKGKKALITGGTSGLGKEIALTFAKAGADVIIVGTNLDRAKSVIQEMEACKAFPDQDMAFEIVDVSQKKLVNEMVDRVLDHFAEIDILVNSAGITRDKLFLKMSEEDWDQVLSINLKSVYNLCHALVKPMMKAKKGKIINITSVIGLTGNPGQVNYAASKSGMIGFTKSLAKELASRGICANCIAPGFFRTPMTDGLSEGQKESILQRIPMGRLGEPKEIAYAAIFLASHLSDYITGQVLTVDGGMLA